MPTTLLLLRFEDMADVHQGSGAAAVECGDQANRRQALLLLLLEDAVDVHWGSSNTEAERNQAWALVEIFLDGGVQPAITVDWACRRAMAMAREGEFPTDFLF
jgi:hypothetical protein